MQMTSTRRTLYQVIIETLHKMGNSARFYIAESNIMAFFRESKRKVFSHEQLAEIL